MNEQMFDRRINHPPCVQGQRILAYGNGYFFEAEFDDGGWCSIGGDDFTHWTWLPPLPESPA